VDEFEIIRTYFATQPETRADVVLGIGDDAALLRVPLGHELVATTDTLVAGVHFLADTDPADLGYRALAVNLSDLAAMGAEPAWATLSLTLPDAEPRWLEGFCRGFYELSREFGVQLVGGNLAHGPLNITVGAYGHVPVDTALRRDGAGVGDAIYVTGVLGDAALALNHVLGRQLLDAVAFASVRARLVRPHPRVAEGLRLRGIASAAIDISDGLLADLGHVLAASGVGARIELSRLPVSDVYRGEFARAGWEPALTQGDDYELCFSVPPGRVAALEALTPMLGCRITRIGEAVSEAGLTVLDASGHRYVARHAGYDHFTQHANKGN
jgi:thiamine-monophosphate kinase